MEAQRIVAHLDLDTFFVSVERINNQLLTNKPVVIGGLSNRGVVSTCSYEARQFGVHSAMPIVKARQLCPHAIFIQGDMDKYRHYSQIVTEIIEQESPVYEKASIDEFYIELTGIDTYYNELEFCKHIQRKILKTTKLPITFGLSTNKTIAKIATGEAKQLPEKYIHVTPPEVRKFLNPLSIKKIPMLGAKAFETLSKYGIATIEELSNFSPSAITKILGKSGTHLWEKANGIDNTPIIPYRAKKSISSEETLEKNTKDRVLLHSLLVKLTEELCYELRQSGNKTQCLAIKIKYSDFKTQTSQKTFSATSSESLLLTIAKELFEALYTNTTPLRLVGVRLSEFTTAYSQLSLFDNVDENQNLYSALDAIKDKFGNRAIKRAAGEM